MVSSALPLSFISHRPWCEAYALRLIGCSRHGPWPWRTATGEAGDAQEGRPVRPWCRHNSALATLRRRLTTSRLSHGWARAPWALRRAPGRGRLPPSFPSRKTTRVRQTLSRGMVMAAAATSVLVCGSDASAAAQVQGITLDLPDVLSGNTVQAPTNLPVDVCGNTITALARQNPGPHIDCADPTDEPDAPHPAGNEHPGSNDSSTSRPRGDNGNTPDSPDVASHNSVRAPVDLPIDICGNAITALARQNPGPHTDCADPTDEPDAPHPAGNEHPGGNDSPLEAPNDSNEPRSSDQDPTAPRPLQPSDLGPMPTTVTTPAVHVPSVALPVPAVLTPTSTTTTATPSVPAVPGSSRPLTLTVPEVHVPSVALPVPTVSAPSAPAASATTPPWDHGATTPTVPHSSAPTPSGPDIPPQATTPAAPTDSAGPTAPRPADRDRVVSTPPRSPVHHPSTPATSAHAPVTSAAPRSVADRPVVPTASTSITPTAPLRPDSGPTPVASESAAEEAWMASTGAEVALAASAAVATLTGGVILYRRGRPFRR
ncbi:chaplin family protein [Streptomyces sp. S.PB5]|uniref:chaplin n=1 Tax=Streptomyces sp. S.PB5 TaxID=3020844 RepID=UPI00339D5548